jgi:hypothetical protein
MNQVQAGIYGVVLNSDGTNTQYKVAVDGQPGVGTVFVEPGDLREDPTNASVLYVSDAAGGPYGTGAIYKVTFYGSSATVSLLNASRNLIHPTVLQWVTDPSSGATVLWVAYAGTQKSVTYDGYLVEMDLSGNVLKTQPVMRYRLLQDPMNMATQRTWRWTLATWTSMQFAQVYRITTPASCKS